MTGYLVAGTQAEKKKDNFVILIKMSQLSKTQQEEEEDGKGSSVGRGLQLVELWFGMNVIMIC